MPAKKKGSTKKVTKKRTIKSIRTISRKTYPETKSMHQGLVRCLICILSHQDMEFFEDAVPYVVQQ